jgi:uncharacterized protein (TIGR02757 family)
MSKLFLPFVNRFIDPKWIQTDPIQFPHRYHSKKDREVVGLISALFAYGNVVAIHKHLESLLSILGDHPFEELRSSNFKNSKSIMNKYRFQTQEDIFIFLCRLQEIYQENESIESFFVSDHLQKGILNFQRYFFSNIRERTNGLNFLIGKEQNHSGYKRWRMFLRWMVREEFPDLGLWKRIQPSQLEFPVDTHIQKLSLILGIRKRKTTDHKLSLEITDYFKKIFPSDPLIMDFPLTRLGITKICKMKKVDSICSRCELRKVCKIYQGEVM